MDYFISLLFEIILERTSPVLSPHRYTLLSHIQPTVESSTPVWTGSSRWPRAARWAESSTRPPRLATSPPTWSAARPTTTSQSRGDLLLHLLSPRWTTCCALVSPDQLFSFQVVRPSSAREEPRSSEGSLAGGQFSGFLAQLEKHGLLKPGALDALKNVMLEEEGRRVEEKEDEEKERMVGSPTGNRLSLKSLQQQRDSSARPISSTETSGPVRSPVSRNSLFARRVPPKRRNKFTGFIPRVKPVGNIENIHPVENSSHIFSTTLVISFFSGWFDPRRLHRGG